MSSEQKQVNVLENFIAKPNSLEAERVGRSYFLDNHSNVIPNEGNLLSLLTMKKFYKGQDEEKWLTSIGQEEGKYLTEAMKMLTAKSGVNAAGDSLANGLSANDLKSAKKLQQKFGSDFNAALGLANMLKSKSEQVEFDSLINPLVAGLSEKTRQNLFIG